MTTGRLRHVLTAIAALGGLALFAYSVREAGVEQIVSGITRVGWGLGPILGLSGLRFLIRAEAWRLCTAVGSRLTLRRAFSAFLAGDALGNITPLGLIASEPTKVLLTRHQLATRESVASLAIDNLVYALSVFAMIGAGIIVMLATVPLPFEFQEVGVAGLIIILVAGSAAIRLFRRTPASASPGTSWRERLVALHRSVMEFSAGHPARLWRAFALDVGFHAVAVLEAYLTLRWLLGDRSPTLSEAVMFESLNRVVTAALKFVPLRVGVDEAASGAFAPLLGMNPAAGVALAVVRKVRSLFWMAGGLLVIAAYHARERSARSRHEHVSVHRT